MEHTLILLFFILKTQAFAVNNQNEKEEFCTNLSCDNNIKINVCGIRQEGEGVRLKLFESECELLKFGCQVDSKHGFNTSAVVKYMQLSLKNQHLDDEISYSFIIHPKYDYILTHLPTAYGIINMEYCEKSLGNSEEIDDEGYYDLYKINKKNNNLCIELNDCNNPSDDEEVCGVRADGDGFRVKLFPNKCELMKSNCEEKLNFSATVPFICKGFQNIENSNEIFEETINEDETATIENIQTPTEETITILPQNFDINRPKNIVIVDGSMLRYNGNINETMDNFFASTHVRALPLKLLDPLMNETTRRRLIPIAGPAMVFKPWIVMPKNISTDRMHSPTLSSCYHKCPQECPDTYAPVCGDPGIGAREPSVMFKNHCFMDAAQCKMRWEDKSSTSESSTYVETSFVMCVGDQLNGLYRFLPLVKSLQHMGRLKKKGHFRYKLRNMKFFNNLLAREPKLMG